MTIDYDKLKAIEKPFGLLDESVQVMIAFIVEDE